jgi:N utilization substance protein A
VLVEEGFTTIDEVAYVPEAELQAIAEFDDEMVEMLRQRAKDVLLTRAVAARQRPGRQPADDLLAWTAWTRSWPMPWRASGIASMDELAEQSVDELMEFDGMDEERAAQLIMKAREPWFAESEQE